MTRRTWSRRTGQWCVTWSAMTGLRPKMNWEYWVPSTKTCARMSISISQFSNWLVKNRLTAASSNDMIWLQLYSSSIGFKWYLDWGESQANWIVLPAQSGDFAREDWWKRSYPMETYSVTFVFEATIPLKKHFLLRNYACNRQGKIDAYGSWGWDGEIWGWIVPQLILWISEIKA